MLALTTAPITGAELIVPLLRRVGEVGSGVKEHEDSIYFASFSPIQIFILGLQSGFVFSPFLKLSWWGAQPKTCNVCLLSGPDVKTE